MPAASDRYFALIEATLRQALARPLNSWTDSEPDTFPLDAVLAATAVRLRMRDACELEEALDAAERRLATATRYVDGAGHQRPMYRSLALRALLRSGRPSAANAVEHLPALESKSPEVVRAVFDAWTICSMSAPLVRSISRTQAISESLLLPEKAIAAIQDIARSQQPDGTFLPRNTSDSLEPQWYDELAILHALSCYASESGDAIVAAAVTRAVAYHAAETQPDHASNHPWAVAAFLAEPDAIPLADMMLHAAGVQEPTTMDAGSLLLLADALDCGRRRPTR